MMEKQLIPAGYKQTEFGIAPDDWALVNFGQMISEMRGGANLSPSDYVQSGISVIPKSGVAWGGVLKIAEKDRQFCKEELRKKYHSSLVNQEYTIIVLRDLVPSGPNIGLIVKIDEISEYLLAQGVYGFKLKSEYSAGYLCQLSNSSEYRKLMKSILVGSTQVHIRSSTLKDSNLLIPASKQEQTAIANALSDVDALIAALETLINKKSAIKTAAMQQLLTGKERLPPFDQLNTGYKQTELGEIPGDWEAGELGDYLDTCSSGATPYRGRPEFYKGSIRWISSGELNYNVIYDTIEKISEDAVKKTNLKIHPKGTFLIAITGLEAAGTRGSCGFVGAPSATNQSCMALYTNNKISTNYLFHYYVYKGDELAFKYCQGTKQQSYTAKIVKLLPIVLPESLEEQTAIANVLSDMDKDLEALQQRLHKTQQIKQGMMQELLTGKTRLI